MATDPVEGLHLRRERQHRTVEGGGKVVAGRRILRQVILTNQARVGGCTFIGGGVLLAPNCVSMGLGIHYLHSYIDWPVSLQSSSEHRVHRSPRIEGQNIPCRTPQQPNVAFEEPLSVALQQIGVLPQLIDHPCIDSCQSYSGLAVRSLKPIQI